jgi:hypothetical protein
MPIGKLAGEMPVNVVNLRQNDIKKQWLSAKVDRLTFQYLLHTMQE